MTQSLEDFCLSLASKTPTPGGGGAAALAGALAAALGSMVGEYTVGKPRYAADEPALKEAMAECTALREALLSLIAADAAAFAPLSRAYGIPKGTPGREAELERCLTAAAAVPMEIMRRAARAIELAALFAEKGSTLMRSDAASAAALGEASLACGAVNVLANTRLMQNRAAAEALEAEAEALLSEQGAKARAVYAAVWEKMKVK
ncbi:MAG: cyclodeaminase/cyclohydrolase family protein [bacterium]